MVFRTYICTPVSVFADGYIIYVEHLGYSCF